MALPNICGQASNALSNLMNSPITKALGSLLEAFGAADVGLRLGTGGQVGVADLPGLLTDTAGIPCYSPQLGDFIYVTPLQFWANGGKCDGLRDPDREELERRIRERQEDARRRNEIRQKTGLPEINNPEIKPEIIKELEKLLPVLPLHEGFFGGNAATEFLVGGTLEIKKSSGSFLVSGGGWPPGPYPTNTSLYNSTESSFTFEIQPGDQIRTTTRPYNNPYDPNSFGIERYVQIWRNGAVVPTQQIGDYRVGGVKQPNPPEIGRHYFLGSYNYSGTNPNFSFTPSDPAPPTTTSNGQTDSIPINTPQPPQPPPEGVCDMGCGCGDMAGQINRANRNIEKLIQEIHKAVGAGMFASGTYSFSPEQQIESVGKKLYQQNPGRGGATQVKNLLEATTALISAHYHRMGLQRLPAKVPDSVIPNSNEQIEAIDIDVVTLHDFLSLWKWGFDQDDMVRGQWPVRYEVKDDDKTKKVAVWNQAEMMGDMYGMLLRILEDSDLGVQWGVRAATEASKSGNAALKTLHLLQEYVKWSGCLTSNGTKDFIKVSCTFSPDPTADPTKAEEMLKPSTQDLQVTNIVDGRSLLGILMSINYWAQISGRANFGDMGAANPLIQTPGQNMNMPGDAIREIRKKERAQNKAWDKWKQKKEAPTTIPAAQQPPGGIPTPNIIVIEQPRQP